MSTNCESTNLQFLYPAVISSFLGPNVPVVVPMSNAVISVFLPQSEVQSIIITIPRNILLHVL